MKQATYYNRTATGRILSVAESTLREWERGVKNPSHPVFGLSLFTPARTALPTTAKKQKAVQYAHRQIELIDEALADWSRVKEIDAQWRQLKQAIARVTFARAESIGLTKGGTHAA